MNVPVPKICNGEQFVAINFGTYSLKMAAYQIENGKMKQLSFIQEFGVTPESSESDIVNALVAFKNSYPCAKKCGVSITSSLCFMRYIKLPPFTEDEKRVKLIVDFEAKQNIPYPMEDIFWDYDLQRASDDDLDCKYTVIKKSAWTPLIRAVKHAGFKIMFVESEVESVLNWCHWNSVLIGTGNTALVMNLGHKSTVAVFYDTKKKMGFARTIPLAGHSASQQISKELGFTETLAVKALHEGVDISKNVKGQMGDVNPDKIARNVAARLHGEINRTISVYRAQGGARPDILILTGGFSKLGGLPEFFEEKLHMMTQKLKELPESTIVDGVCFRVIPGFQPLCNINLMNAANAGNPVRESLEAIGSNLLKLANSVRERAVEIDRPSYTPSYKVNVPVPNDQEWKVGDKVGELVRTDETLGVMEEVNSTREAFDGLFPPDEDSEGKSGTSLMPSELALVPGGFKAINDSLLGTPPSDKQKNYLPEYKAPEYDVKSPEDRMLRTLYKFSYDLASSKSENVADLSVATKFYLMLHGFFHNGK